MKKLLSLGFLTSQLVLSIVMCSFAQDALYELPKPLLLNKELLSGIGIDRLNIEETPDKEFYQTRLYGGDDLSIYILSSESWLNTFEPGKFWLDEYVYLFNGASMINSKGKPKTTFYDNDFFYIPKGFVGNVEILAGDQLHCELSVITTKRAEQSNEKFSKDVIKFDPMIVAGTDINFIDSEIYSRKLVVGPELTFTLYGERSNYSKSINMEEDQFIQLMYGQITITDESKTHHVFNAGDFFIIPKGVKGKWTSKGHNFTKYLSVTKS